MKVSWVSRIVVFVQCGYSTKRLRRGRLVIGCDPGRLFAVAWPASASDDGDSPDRGPLVPADGAQRSAPPIWVVGFRTRRPLMTAPFEQQPAHR